MDTQRAFDILDIPVEGLAAYWLSLKKLVEGKRNFKSLHDEVAYTSEPFIKFLLENILSPLDEVWLRSIAATRQEHCLAELERKFNLMRTAVLDVAASENPRKSLAKMAAQYGRLTVDEKQTFHYVHELVRLALKGERSADDEPKHYFNVTHKLSPEQLMVTLLFYVFWARKEGKEGCRPFLETSSSAFFVSGLSLVIDGFETPFVRKWLKVHRDVVLDELRQKLTMSTELSLAIRQKLPYEAVFQIAKAWLP